MKHFAGRISRANRSITGSTPMRAPEPETDEPSHQARETQQQSILNLQGAIGNSAVRRMVQRTPAAAAQQVYIQRRMQFTSANLAGKKAPASALSKLKDNAALSTYRKIEATLEKYEQTSDFDNAAQYKLISDLVALTDKWLGDYAHLKQEDQAKHDSLTALNQQAKAEYPKALIAEKLGLVHELIDTLAAADVTLLADAIELLEVGKGISGMAMFTKAKPGLGNAALLVEAFLKRNYIGVVESSMMGMMNDPAFKQDTKQSGPAAIATMKSAAQAKLDRLKELDDQQKTAVAELTSSKGAKKQDDFPILNATDPLCIEYGKLRMQRAQYESIVNGKAVADKKKNEFKDLNDAEMTGLIGYTSDLYGQVNTPLRSQVGGGMDAGKKALIGATVSGLNKLKPYKGTVYRHANDFTGYAETHRPGAVVSDMAFLSTAKEQKGCASAAENHGSLEILVSKSGRDVSKASVFGDKEAEILFRPGTKFTVTHVIRRDPQKWGQKHDEADWGPKNSPRFRDAMDHIATEPAFINNFHYIVYKTEVG